MSPPSNTLKSSTSTAEQREEPQAAPPPYSETEIESHAVTFTCTYVDPNALTRVPEKETGGESSGAENPYRSLAETLKHANEIRSSEDPSPSPMPYLRADEALGPDDSSEFLVPFEPEGEDSSTEHSVPVSEGSSVDGSIGQANSAGGCLSALASLAVRTGGSVRALISKNGRTWNWWSICLGGPDDSDNSSDSKASVVHVLLRDPDDGYGAMHLVDRVIMASLRRLDTVRSGPIMGQEELSRLLEQGESPEALLSALEELSVSASEPAE